MTGYQDQMNRSAGMSGAAESSESKRSRSYLARVAMARITRPRPATGSSTPQNKTPRGGATGEGGTMMADAVQVAEVVNFASMLGSRASDRQAETRMGDVSSSSSSAGVSSSTEQDSDEDLGDINPDDYLESGLELTSQCLARRA